MPGMHPLVHGAQLLNRTKRGHAAFPAPLMAAEHQVVDIVHTMIKNHDVPGLEPDALEDAHLLCCVHPG